MEADQPIADNVRRDFYVYVHRRATDDSIFYVGKGCGKRAFRTDRNPHWRRVFVKHGRRVEIVHSCLTEDEAFDHEKALIAKYGLDSLCNLTEGGDGMSGYVHPPEILKAAAEKRRGQKRSPEQLERLRAGQLGKVVSAEHAAKLSAALKGRPTSEATKAGFERWFTPERQESQIAILLQLARERTKPVVCVETGATFSGAKLAAEWLDRVNMRAAAGNIRSCCAGLRKQAYGYRWRYAD